MLNKTPSWTTTDGKVHTNYTNALKHELTCMFAKSADNDVIAKKIVDAMTPPFIDEAVSIMRLIKDEMVAPSQFEVILIEKPVTGIEDILPNTSLGVVGDEIQDPPPPADSQGVINNSNTENGRSDASVQFGDPYPEGFRSSAAYLEGKPTHGAAPVDQPSAKTFVDPSFNEAQRDAA